MKESTIFEDLFAYIILFMEVVGLLGVFEIHISYSGSFISIFLSEELKGF